MAGPTIVGHGGAKEEGEEGHDFKFTKETYVARIVFRGHNNNDQQKNKRSRRIMD